MPIRPCAQCGRAFKAPGHVPGQPTVLVCDRHATKPKRSRKPEPEGTDAQPAVES